MKIDINKIIFEKKKEVESILDALYRSKQNDNKDVEKMIRLLELMYMEW